jgi:hypothetical protein
MNYYSEITQTATAPIRGDSCIANKNNKLNVKYLLTFDTTEIFHGRKDEE